MNDSGSKSTLTDEEARALIGGHVLNTRDWYVKQSASWEFRSLALQYLFFFLSAAITIVAAYPFPRHNTSTIGPEDWAKYIIVILSASATLVSALLSRGGAERIAKLRELGRIKLTAPLEKAILRFTRKPMTDEERLVELEALYDKLAKIEAIIWGQPAGGRKRKVRRGFYLSNSTLGMTRLVALIDTFRSAAIRILALVGHAPLR